MRVLAVSTGCPASIGPEISIAAALARPRVRLLLIGDEALLRAEAATRGAEDRVVVVESAEEASALDDGAIPILRGPRLTEPVIMGHPDAACGRAQLGYVKTAMRLAERGEAAAMVTAAVSKHAIASSGAKGSKTFRGHTEYLMEQLGAREVVMAFACERFVTSLVTTHLPLRRVPDAIDRKGVARAIYWLARLLRDLGKPSPRIAVSGLNPHAGEGGILGKEEEKAIVPGVQSARKRLDREGISAAIDGPIGAETAYRRAASGAFDGVVGMFHDQATIPMKVLSFGEAVNITLGLPIIRTSVDHGTGYDIAGQGVAKPDGLIAAIDLADRLARASDAA
ncbi:MAG: 4-hydroxythreonine-4-phosphate dehydrogenase PdxA [Polyangiaceae bacterium]